MTLNALGKGLCFIDAEPEQGVLGVENKRKRHGCGKGYHEERTGFQCLMGFRVLCGDCHGVKHILSIRDRKTFDHLTRHFMFVNKVNEQVFLVYVFNAEFSQSRFRYRHGFISSNLKLQTLVRRSPPQVDQDAPWRADEGGSNFFLVERKGLQKSIRNLNLLMILKVESDPNHTKSVPQNTMIRKNLDHTMLSSASFI